MNKHIAIFGCPLRIYSDNGLEFTGKVFTELAAQLEIGLKHSPPHNAQSDKVERFHQTLNTGMRMFLDKKTSLGAPSASYSHGLNMKICMSNGVTPFLPDLEREAKFPADMILLLPDTEYQSVPAHVQAVLARYQAVFEAIQRQEDGTIRRNAAAYVGTAKFEVGDVVWYLAPRLVPGKAGMIIFLFYICCKYLNRLI